VRGRSHKTSTYGQSLVVIKIGVEEVNVGAVDLGGNLLLCCLDIADKSNNNVVRVGRKLAKVLELE
jgi:hypothetical protein